MLIRFTHDLRPALAGNLIAKGHAKITQRNAPAPTIEHSGERAEQKGQPITSFARQKRNEFRGGFDPQPLQTVANPFPSPAHRSSVRTFRTGCERPPRHSPLPVNFFLLTSHFFPAIGLRSLRTDKFLD